MDWYRSSLAKDDTQDKLQTFTEFETKYLSSTEKCLPFKLLVQTQFPQAAFLYAQGRDYYFTRPDGSFLRYRKSENEGDRAELTIKQKPMGAQHNIERKEVNIRVDGNSVDAIFELASMQGYQLSFTIWKGCHIYKTHDATLVFYEVVDEKNQAQAFIEIELHEELTHKLSRDQAYSIISSYENLLESLGVVPQKRVQKSLFEMYSPEK